MYCNECEALSETCCQASKARRATAISLGRLVTRQEATIKALREAFEAQRLLLADLMARSAA